MQRIKAEFDGECAICEEPIYEHISWIVQVDGCWVHADCAEDEGYEE